MPTRLPPARSALEPRGYVIAPDLVSEPVLERIEDELHDDPGARRRGGVLYGSRNLLALPSVDALVRSPRVHDVLIAALGMEAACVRALCFAKSARANWRLGWHQDRAVAVRERPARVPAGFGRWSVKASVPHVWAPQTVMASMLTLRLHLDDADARSGALMLLPGTQNGLHAEADLEQRAAHAVTPSLRRGDALLMRPLLAHASARTADPNRQRRVLHFEFATTPLPAPMEWHDWRPAAQIRRANADDVEPILDVRVSTRENHLDRAQLAARGITSETLRARLSNGSRAWVVDSGDRILAFAMADDDGRIDALFVRPEAQGLGWGSALLDRALRWLAEQPSARPWLTTEPGSAAFAFYERRGFRDSGERRGDDAVMVRDASRAAAGPGSRRPGP